jgi:hypothetical protein
MSKTVWIARLVNLEMPATVSVSIILMKEVLRIRGVFSTCFLDLNIVARLQHCLFLNIFISIATLNCLTTYQT